MAPMYSQNTQMLRRALRLLALARTLALTLTLTLTLPLTLTQARLPLLRRG